MIPHFDQHLEQEYGKEIADRYRALIQSSEYRQAKGGYAKHDKPNFYKTRGRKK